MIQLESPRAHPGHQITTLEDRCEAMGRAAINDIIAECRAEGDIPGALLAIDALSRSRWPARSLRSARGKQTPAA